MSGDYVPEEEDAVAENQRIAALRAAKTLAPRGLTP